MPSTHTVDTGELTLTYAEGRDSGPPVVLLHGVTGNRQVFAPLMQVLGNRWHVYACDLRGHGESGRAPERDGYLLSDHVGDVSALLHHIAPDDEPVVLAGFSLGAMIALGATGAMPTRVRGLILIEPPLMMRDGSQRSYPIWSMISLAHDVTRRSQEVEYLLTLCREVSPDQEETALMTRATQLSLIDPAVADLILLDRFLDGVDLTEVVGQVRCPILLIYGDQGLGGLIGREDVEWLREHASHVETPHVPGGGHDIFLEQPEAVNRHLLSFLDKL